MAYDPSNYYDSPEELELRRRRATKKRIRLLAVICIVSIGARIMIRNPEPPKQVDRSKEKLRVVPGMLDKLSASTLAKMDPVLLARIKAEEARMKEEELQKSASSKWGSYKPAEQPVTDSSEEEKLKQTQYAYIKRQQKRMEQLETQRKAVDSSKNILILFRSGGLLKVENVDTQPHQYRIRVDKSLSASYSKSLVSAVNTDASTWTEPIPAGSVQLKPARGITITVARETAKRITLKTTTDES